MAKKGRKATKNMAMITVRNKTKQEVTNVIFPNGLTVGLDDLKFRNGAKVHGNLVVDGDFAADNFPSLGDDGLTFNFTQPVIVVPTDSSGGALDDGSDLSDADISALAYTTVDATQSATTLQFEGHGTSSDTCSDNTYRVIVGSIAATTDTGHSLTVTNTAAGASGDETFEVVFKESSSLKLTLDVSKVDDDIKLLVTDLAEHDSDGDDISSIVVSVPFRVTTPRGDETVTRSFTITKILEGEDAYNLWAINSGQITAGTVASDGTVTNNASDFVSIKGLRGSTTIAFNGDTAGAEGTTDDRFALDVETTDKITGHSYDVDGSERDVHSTWNSTFIELRDNATDGSIIAKLTPSDTGNDAKLLLTDFAKDQRGSTANVLQSIHIIVPVDVFVNNTAVTGYPISLSIVKVLPGEDAVSFSFNKSAVNIPTDHDGGAVDDGGDLGAGDIPASSYVRVAATVGITDLEFDGSCDSASATPSLNEYQLYDLGVSAFDSNGLVFDAVVAADTSSTGDGDLSYTITIEYSTVDKFSIGISKTSNHANLLIATLAEHNTGTADYNSITVQVPFRVTTAAGTQTITRSFDIVKIKAPQDPYVFWATNAGQITAGTVAAGGLPSDNAADFVLIKGRRGGTTIVFNGNTAGAEGTTDNRFALDISSADDKVTGHSYATDGSERDVYSTWESSYLALRDGADAADPIIAKLTPSDTGDDAKLLLTEFALLCNSKVLQSIHVTVPLDAYVNNTVVSAHPISLSIIKVIPAGTVNLHADYTQVSYTADGDTPNPAGNITLTATSQGLKDAFFKFTGGTGDLSSPNGGLSTAESTWRDGASANETTRLWDTPASYSATPVTITVSVKDDSASNSVVATDTLTISSYKPGSDSYTMWATSGGQITAGTVDSDGAVTNNAGDFLLIKGLRKATTIVYNGGTTDGSEGTTADRFSLDIGTANDKVTGYSYATDASQRAVYSNYEAGGGSPYLELKDGSASGTTLARLTPTDTGDDAKLLLTVFATECNSKILESIHVTIPVDIYVNGAAVENYPVPIVISKNIPGADGNDGVAVLFSFNKPAIHVSTDADGGAIDDGGDLASADIPSTAFVLVDASVGTTALEFEGGCNSASDTPSLNNYYLYSLGITATDSNGAVFDAVVSGDLTNHDGSDTDTAYDITVEDGTVDKFSINVSKPDDDAKLLLTSLAEHIVSTTDYDSITVDVPFRVTTTAGTQTITRSFDIIKVKQPEGPITFEFTKSTITIPTDTAGGALDDGGDLTDADIPDTCRVNVVAAVGTTELTFAGSCDSASDTPNEGTYYLYNQGITAIDSNGAVFDAVVAGDLASHSGNDGDLAYYIIIEDGGVDKFSFDVSSVDSQLQLKCYTLAKYIVGTTEYDSITVDIPFRVTTKLGTQTITRSFDIVKSKTATDGTDGSTIVALNITEMNTAVRAVGHWFPKTGGLASPPSAGILRTSWSQTATTGYNADSSATLTTTPSHSDATNYNKACFARVPSGRTWTIERVTGTLTIDVNIADATMSLHLLKTDNDDNGDTNQDWTQLTDIDINGSATYTLSGDGVFSLDSGALSSKTAAAGHGLTIMMHISSFGGGSAPTSVSAEIVLEYTSA